MRTDDYGKLILRLTLGVLMLFHGAAKLANGIGGIVTRITDLGLPGFLGYLVFIGEVVAPLFLLAGYWTRGAALVIAANMLVAVLLVHTGDFLARTGAGGWQLELQAFYLLTAVAIVCLGAGRYSVGGPNQRWN